MKYFVIEKGLLYLTMIKRAVTSSFIFSRIAVCIGAKLHNLNSFAYQYVLPSLFIVPEVTIVYQLLAALSAFDFAGFVTNTQSSFVSRSNSNLNRIINLSLLPFHSVVVSLAFLL